MFNGFTEDFPITLTANSISHPTNADRLRVRDDEELAEFLYSVEKRRCYCGKGGQWISGKEAALDWLRRPAERGE